jgi:hypothetical protein
MTEAVTQGPVSPVGLGIASKKKRRRPFLLGLLILICGIAIGTGGTVVVMKHIILNAIQHSERVPQRITDRMRGKLGLTEDQAAKVKAILTERQKKIQALLRQVRPEVDKEFEKAKEDVAAILKPDQAKKWRERFDRLRIWFPAPPANRSGSGDKLRE